MKSRSKSVLTLSLVGLVLILGAYHFTREYANEMLEPLNRRDNWQSHVAADPTWVLEHKTVKTYKKNRPLPWSSTPIPDEVKAAMDKLNAARVPQDDPELIRLIRDYYIEPPSLLPCNLKYPHREDFSKGQSPFVDSRLGHMVSKI